MSFIIKQYNHLNIWRDQLTDDRILTYKAKLVGFILSQYFKPEYPTYPSIRTLSEASSLTVNPIQDGIKELIDNGFIMRKQSRKQGDRFLSNNYSFILHVSLYDTCNDTSDDISHDTSPDDTEYRKEQGKKKNIEKKEILEKFEKIYKAFNEGKNIKVIPFDKLKIKFENCLKEITFEELEKNVTDYLDYLKIADWRKKKAFDAWINSSESYANDWINEKRIELEKKKVIIPTESNINQILCDFVNKIAKHTLITKIIVSTPNKAALYFDKKEDYHALAKLPQNLKDEIKQKISSELKINDFEYKY